MCERFGWCLFPLLLLLWIAAWFYEISDSHLGYYSSKIVFLLKFRNFCLEASFGGITLRQTPEITQNERRVENEIFTKTKCYPVVLWEANGQEGAWWLAECCLWFTQHDHSLANLFWLQKDAVTHHETTFIETGMCVGVWEVKCGPRGLLCFPLSFRL